MRPRIIAVLAKWLVWGRRVGGRVGQGRVGSGRLGSGWGRRVGGTRGKAVGVGVVLGGVGQSETEMRERERDRERERGREREMGKRKRMRECGRQRERDLDRERERGTQGCLEKVSNSFDTRHRHMLAQQESQPDTAPTAAKLQTRTHFQISCSDQANLARLLPPGLHLTRLLSLDGHVAGAGHGQADSHQSQSLARERTTFSTY